MLEASATQSFADGLSCVSLKQIVSNPVSRIGRAYSDLPAFLVPLACRPCAASLPCNALQHARTPLHTPNAPFPINVSTRNPFFRGIHLSRITANSRKPRDQRLKQKPNTSRHTERAGLIHPQSCRSSAQGGEKRMGGRVQSERQNSALRGMRRLVEDVGQECTQSVHHGEHHGSDREESSCKCWVQEHPRCALCRIGR